MLLRNINILGEREPGPKNIIINGDRIASIENVATKPYTGIDFTGALAFPGLINSHDHLDFELFPRLGNKIYRSYREWGHDIHLANKQDIANTLHIPRALRIRWGMYKNLLNGFTTVVNHGERLPLEDAFINVYQEADSLHSVGFEKRWRWKLNKLQRKTIAIHTGEGTDDLSHKEIESLIRWNLLRKKLVGIHGVAMTTGQAASFEGLVWCHSSNDFLLGKTAMIDQLKNHTNILFGTDSALTSEWNLWSQLRKARQSNMLSDMALYESVTSKAVKVWKMPGTGRLVKDHPADIVIARKKGHSGDLQNFYSINPADILLVMHNGNIRVMDESVYSQLPQTFTNVFSKIKVDGVYKFVTGDIRAMVANTIQYHPEVSLPFTFAD